MEFQMTKPVGYGTTITIVVICGFLICLAVFFFLMLISSRSYTLTVTNDRLDIQSIFYNTHIKLADIQIEQMRMINYNSLSINLRMNGIGLPGMSIGWFQGNGKKYKVYVTDKNNVLLIPTKMNYDILFSTTEGNEIIKEIKTHQE